MATQTYDEAVRHKQSLAAGGARAAGPGAIWRTVVFPNAQSAADFLNVTPAQVAGEAFASNRPDGQVDVYYFL